MKDIYNHYDQIVASLLSYLQTKEEIILNEFEMSNPNHLLMFEISKIASIYFKKEIKLNMPFLNFLLFKIKNRKIESDVKFKRERKINNSGIDITKLLENTRRQFKDEDKNIFEKIYHEYYDRKRMKKGLKNES